MDGSTNVVARVVRPAPAAVTAAGHLPVPPLGSALDLGTRRFDPGEMVVMAIVNRTPDSFYAPARHPSWDGVKRAVEDHVRAGADLLDIGGVKAGVGDYVSEDEEVDRVLPLVEWVRAQFPDLVVSVDTWRSKVAAQVCQAGAGLINDTWAGVDPEIVHVAARYGAAVVISHTGGAQPRTLPHRVRYAHSPDGVVGEVLQHLETHAARAVQAGVKPTSVLVDPTHDFGKNTWHSLALLRCTAAIVGLGYPVLMALSRKDFVGESLDLPVHDRLEGTLASVTVAAWNGATVFRVHDVAATRRTLDMVATIRGDRRPQAAWRALA